jgi:hypothetical protein
MLSTLILSGLFGGASNGIFGVRPGFGAYGVVL